jgi:hypothetical protein
MKISKPKTKPKHDWPSLFAYQKESGLTVADFCSVHKISPSSFYLNKQQVSTQSDFVEAKVVHRVSEQITELTSSAQVITLTTKVGELSFPDSIPSDFLVSVIKGLS